MQICFKADAKVLKHCYSVVFLENEIVQFYLLIKKFGTVITGLAIVLKSLQRHSANKGCVYVF